MDVCCQSFDAEGGQYWQITLLHLPPWINVCKLASVARDQSPRPVPSEITNLSPTDWTGDLYILAHQKRVCFSLPGSLTGIWGYSDRIRPSRMTRPRMPSISQLVFTRASAKECSKYFTMISVMLHFLIMFWNDIRRVLFQTTGQRFRELAQFLE